MFSALDLFFFFVAFEIILIPMFSIIGLFGSNKRRTKAAYYFFMYSFIFSLFSLFLIIFIYSIANTTNLLELISCHRLSYNQQLIS